MDVRARSVVRDLATLQQSINAGVQGSAVIDWRAELKGWDLIILGIAFESTSISDTPFELLVNGSVAFSGETGGAPPVSHGICPSLSEPLSIAGLMFPAESNGHVHALQFKVSNNNVAAQAVSARVVVRLQQPDPQWLLDPLQRARRA